MSNTFVIVFINLLKLVNINTIVQHVYRIILPYTFELNNVLLNVEINTKQY